LVHDVNAVHGLLDVMGVEAGPVLGATVFANGSGGQAAVALMGGRAIWNLVYIEVPKLANYKERISLYFDDEIVELVFPAPYLNHHPTRLRHRTSAGARLGTMTIRARIRKGLCAPT
jgi:hypothetical protein